MGALDAIHFYFEYGFINKKELYMMQVALQEITIAEGEQTCAHSGLDPSCTGRPITVCRATDTCHKQ